MSVVIDKEALFKDKLRTGINLFTGAGFSVLPFNGRSLPTAAELCKEICEKYDIPENFGNNLEIISELVPKQGYQDFLRKKFTVTGCNELYNHINNINLKSFITTNIDNIPYFIISNINRYFLKNIAYYGSSKSVDAKLDFIPLHGDVKNINFPLYFGKFDLAVVDDINRELFNEMNSKLLAMPTFFWGYGFHDSGVLKTISKILAKKAQDFWVQCLPDDQRMISLFREKGCNVIIGDTESLLNWIKDNIEYTKHKQEGQEVFLHDLKRYLIPDISEIESLPAYEYYVNGVTHWYPILSKQAYESSMVNNIYNEALNSKNVMIVGGHFVGKSTLLMQLALKIDASNKLYIKDTISKEEAKFIISKLNNSDAWIFLENGAQDIESLSIIAKAKNIKLISVSDDYSFESSKHLLEGIKYARIEVGDIDKREAERIFEHIPQGLRHEKFKYKSNDNEKYSILELILKNVKGVLSRDRISAILSSIKSKNENAIKAIALASYLASNGSALSSDVIFSYFNLKSYSEVKNLIALINSALREHQVEIRSDTHDQDYYILRSKIFAKYTSESFTKNIMLKKIYADVIREFIFNVSILKIYNYNIFKRKAYDSNLFSELYDEDGIKIYDFLYDRYKNPYILQQKALFLGKLGRYSEAFAYINKARGELPNNFSIKNSEAILLFEANKSKKSELAVSKMREAMKILDNCYSNDKRKVYHAQKYADFALIFYDKYMDIAYIDKAKAWIDEIIRNKDSLSRRTLKLKGELDFIANP